MSQYKQFGVQQTSPEQGFDRVNNFWEKSSARIERPKLGTGFEQDGSACELAIGQACGSMLVLEDA
ncbi:MAG: hypothetical protein IKX58_03735, partial [Clostridia bacterium]|nr:hypothetical protein [Clostridia bacterium]